MPAPIKVLTLQEAPVDVVRLTEELRRGGFDPQWRELRGEDEFSAIGQTGGDVVLIGGSTPLPAWEEVVRRIRSAGVDLPLIVVQGVLEPAEIESALKLGINDYIPASGGVPVARAIQRGQLERRLRQSEEQYRSMIEGAMEGVVVHEGGVVRFANRSAARLAGYEHAAELLGRSIWDTFVAPEARTELEERAAACLQGRPQGMHPGWPAIRKDGGRGWVQSSVALITWHGRPALLGYFSEITQRREAEESLRASEERFSKAFHGSPLPVSIVAVQTGRYIDANQSLLAMVGLRREELIGRTSLEIGLWVEPAQRTELVRLVRERSVAKSFETRLRVKSGAIRNVLISAELIQLGQEQCMIVVTQDMTEHRRLEEQFRQAQKMEAVGQLAGGVAHDFNNLLTVIQGHASLLKDQRGLPDPVREAADQISFAAERAASLTRQLLTFSRRQVMQLREVDLNEVIDRTGKMLRRILGEDIELVFHHAPALPQVQADPGMIEQVLLNLAVNSRDAMPHGGRLTIATAAAMVSAEASRRSPDATPGRAVCITVMDNGCGIAPENLDRVFEPFFTTKGVGKGTGLGLASAYGIIKQHKGWIQVSSELNRGTTFELFLPAIHRDPSVTGAGPASPPARGGREGILLVEDEPAVRTLVRTLLERYGYEVFDAHCGRTALLVWEHQKARIDLLLTDLVMPGGLSGQELAAQLQAERPALKIIFSSGYSPQVVAQHLILEPGVNFLQKPYEPRVLAQTVRACLDARRS